MGDDSSMSKGPIEFRHCPGQRPRDPFVIDTLLADSRFKGRRGCMERCRDGEEVNVCKDKYFVGIDMPGGARYASSDDAGKLVAGIYAAFGLEPLVPSD